MYITGVVDREVTPVTDDTSPLHPSVETTVQLQSEVTDSLYLDPLAANQVSLLQSSDM